MYKKALYVCSLFVPQVTLEINFIEGSFLCRSWVVMDGMKSWSRFLGEYSQNFLQKMDKYMIQGTLQNPIVGRNLQ